MTRETLRFVCLDKKMCVVLYNEDVKNDPVLSGLRAHLEAAGRMTKAHRFVVFNEEQSAGKSTAMEPYEVEPSTECIMSVEELYQHSDPATRGVIYKTKREGGRFDVYSRFSSQ